MSRRRAKRLPVDADDVDAYGFPAYYVKKWRRELARPWLLHDDAFAKPVPGRLLATGKVGRRRRRR